MAIVLFVFLPSALLFWVFDDSVQDPIFTLLQPDVIEVQIAPCDQRLSALGVTDLVSTYELSGSCLRPITDVMGPRGFPVAIYARVPSSSR